MPSRKTPKKGLSPSPDPLGADHSDIGSSHPTPSKTSQAPKTTPAKAKLVNGTPKSGRGRKAREEDESEPPSKKRRKVDQSPTPRSNKKTPTLLPAEGKKARTPLDKASPASNIRASDVTPSNRPAPSASAKKATLGSSAGKTLPTPTRPKAVITSRTPSKALAVEKEPMPNFDEAFAPSPSTARGADKLGSRETFLKNESMKRAREARNFLYEGEADAPTLTRSGRVVGAKGKGKGRERQVDEYGEVIDGEEGSDDEVEESNAAEEDGMDIDEQDSAVLRGTHGAGEEIELDEPPIEDGDKLNPLPRFVRAHFVNILHTLAGRHVASDPPPFEEEGTNEALHQLLGVLQGTVERGEGNSALVVGPRGSGKTRTVARALNLLDAPKASTPIIVRLSGHAQTNDRLAIREMGRQIAEAEGHRPPAGGDDEEGGEEDGEEYAPTTLPSHLLALLTMPSRRAVVIVMEEFDLFTEHARQALLYCLLDVVQSVKTGPVETTGRGVAVIGLTTRTDTLLLLEKRVKSRFSHRIFRVISPLAPTPTKEGEEAKEVEEPWRKLLSRTLIPWVPSVIGESPTKDSISEEELWKSDWEFAVETLLVDPRVVRYMNRLTALSTDVRGLYRPFIPTLASMLASNAEYILARNLSARVIEQIEGAGWGLQNSKIRGLPHPAMGILIISKHLHYAGREEFNFAQVEEEYLRFARTKLVGSGKTRWAIGVLKTAYEHLLRIGILIPTHTGTVRPQFQRVRCTIGPHEVVGWFKGEGANLLGPELGNWGRMMGGHA